MYTVDLRKIINFLSLSTVFALPSELGKLPLAAEDIDSKAPRTNTTASNPIPATPITCISAIDSPKLTPSDCGYILNGMLLREPNIFKERIFRRNSYRTDAGGYARSRWQYGNCQVSVLSDRFAVQPLTLYNVALSANNIVHECVSGVRYPIGGVSIIGDVSEGMYVLLEGHVEPDRLSSKNSHPSQQPAVSVSKRATRSQQDSENSARAPGVKTRNPVTSVSRVSNRPILISNLTLSPAAPPRYPAQCFNPAIIHLPPAAATDCIYVINQIILRRFDPTRQLTFGFTDAADVNLARAENQKWQFGQCMVSVKNNDESRVDTFRMLDVASTARRISIQCLVDTQDKIGGVAYVGTDARGFYIYVGGPLDSSPGFDDVMLLRGSTGAESS